MNKIYSFFSKYEKLIVAVSLLTILLCLIFTGTHEDKPVLFKPVDTSTYELYTAWNIKSGDQESFQENLPYVSQEISPITFSKQLSHVHSSKDKLAIRVVCDDFTVFIDDEEIYSYRNPNDRFFQKNVAYGWHLIDLNPEQSRKDLEIVFTNSGEVDPRFGIYDAYIGKPGEIYFSILKNNGDVLRLALISFVVGFMIFFIYIVFVSFRKRKGNLILYLGLFSAAISIYVVGYNANIISFILDGEHLRENVTYAGIFLMYPSYILFAREVFTEKHKKIFDVLLVIVNFELILFMILIIFGFTSHTFIEIPIYVTFGIILLISFFCWLNHIRKNLKKIDIFYTVLSLISLTGVGIEVYFMRVHDELKITYLPYIIAVWTLVLIINEIRNIFAEVAHTEKLSYYKKSFMTDNLTNLNNKNAFNYFIENYTHENNNQETEYQNVAISVDINDLKKINDNFGHDMGNDAIINVAKTMGTVFDSEEYVIFRLGGDEFLVLGKTENRKLISDKVEQAKEMISKIDSQKPYNLSAAFGYSFLDDDKDSNLIKVIERSDALMYEAKRKAKQDKANKVL